MDEHSDRQRFAEQIARTGTGIVVTSMVVSDSLLEDGVFLIMEHGRAARAFYDDPTCDYCCLSTDDYEYTPGPFAYRSMPGDLPPGAVLSMGRVRITKRPTP